jgi:magnesium-protoporphyrin IX monomethyl ester (oxidative) cyclase
MVLKREKRAIRKILLVVPPTILPMSTGRTSQPPLGVAYLAASLERDGFEVSILDSICEGFERTRSLDGQRYAYGLDVDEIVSRIANGPRPDVVGISCISSLQYGFARKIGKSLAGLPSPPVLAIGGAHASALPKEVVTDSAFDIAVIGEAENTFPQVLKCLSNGDYSAIGNIEGIVLKTESGIMRTPGVGIVGDLDSIPFPARHLLPMERYAMLRAPHDATVRNWPATTVITSRGCPAQCSFCSIHNTMGNAYRTRSVESVIAELIELKDKWGIKEIQFEDDNLTLNRERARKLFQAMIDEKLNLTWSTPNGIALWTLEPEIIDLMAASGCHKLNFAVESGVQRVLDEVICKPLKLEKVPALLDRARKNNITVHTFFVIGFPRETRSEIMETVRFAAKLNSDSTNFFIATPYPGTPLYNEAKANGLLPKDFSFDGLDINIGTIEHPEISPGELTALVAREDAKMRFKRALRPVNLRRTLKRVVQDPVRVVNYFRRLASMGRN